MKTSCDQTGRRLTTAYAGWAREAGIPAAVTEAHKRFGGDNDKGTAWVMRRVGGDLARVWQGSEEFSEHFTLGQWVEMVQLDITGEILHFADSCPCRYEGDFFD